MLPLIVFTNAWPLDLARDWHFPVAHSFWATDERQTALTQAVKALFYPLDPIPEFSTAAFTAPLGKTGRRATGILIGRRDRLQRTTYLAIAAAHEAREAPLSIWRALRDRVAPLIADPTTVTDAHRHAATDLADSPTVTATAAHDGHAVADACESRLQAVGRGWREFYSALDRGPTAAFTTTDGRQIHLATTDGAFGPIDAEDLFTLWFIRRDRPATAAFATLSTVHGAAPKMFTGVARFAPPEPRITPAQVGAESAPEAKRATTQKSSPAVVANPSAEWPLRGRRGWMAAGLVASGVLLGSVWVCSSMGHSPPPTPGPIEPANAPLVVPPDASADSLRGRLVQAFREFVAEHPGSDDLAVNLAVLADTAREPAIAGYLRFLLDGTRRASAAPPPDATAPDAAALAEFCESPARLRELAELMPDANGRASTDGPWRRQLVDVSAFLARHLPLYAALLARRKTGR